MKDIAIYGAGGFGREVACMIDEINVVERTVNGEEWNLAGFFDDGKQVGSDVAHFGKVLGGIDELNAWERPLSVALCFGSPRALKAVRTKITNPLIDFPNLIHPSFACADPATVVLGRGNIIKSNFYATTNVKIGDFNVFNGSNVIGHDAAIGSYNVFMPACRVSGEVEIGNCNLFGALCFIKQQIKIGDNVVVSPLSALLTKPKNGCTYIGNPAKIFKF